MLRTPKARYFCRILSHVYVPAHMFACIIVYICKDVHIYVDEY